MVGGAPGLSHVLAIAVKDMPNTHWEAPLFHEPRFISLLGKRRQRSAQHCVQLCCL